MKDTVTVNPSDKLEIKVKIAGSWRYRSFIGAWLIRLGCALIASRVDISFEDETL